MKKILFLLLPFLTLLFISCSDKKENPGDMPDLSPEVETQLVAKATSLFGKMPDVMPGSENDTPELIDLGKKLYNETALSVNGTQSCNTCHDITNGKAGVDNKALSDGAIKGTKGTRNSPTVLNAGFHFVQFWDGRAKDLQEQAGGPILNPVEMGMPNEAAVVKAITGIAEYKDLFAKVYPNDKAPITYNNITNAIAAFERTLISRSRFDFYLAGNKKSLTNKEKNGLKLFTEVGCITCHSGHQIGANLFQKMGLVKAYENTKDLGRYDVTKAETDKYMFKVASLRNAALTYPYFHDGAVEKLEDAVKKMAIMNVGKELKVEEVDQLVAFIGSLSDFNLTKIKK
jgi:cytochrome c peroxidase